MYPFMISEMTKSDWVFQGGYVTKVPRDQILINTQKSVDQTASVKTWLSHWEDWSGWGNHEDPQRSQCSPDIQYGSELPTKKRTCPSTKTFYCIGAEDKNKWTQRHECPALCGNLTNENENCLNIGGEGSYANWVRTKCVSSLKKPNDGQHACGITGQKLTLPVPMTKTELQKWLQGYDQCNFEFHSAMARLPVGLLIEDSDFISLLNGAKTLPDFNLQTALDGGWRKESTGCYRLGRYKKAGLNEKRCGPNGYCCSGPNKDNGGSLHTIGACPNNARQFIVDNKLESRHHCLREGIFNPEFVSKIF